VGTERQADQRSIIITGAGGFVGGHIAAAASDAGYRVIAVDRSFATSHVNNRKIETIEGESGCLTDLRADYLIHAAAITAKPEELGMTPIQHFRANTEIMFEALTWVEKHHPKRAIFISSDSVYGPNPGTMVVEEAQPNPQETYSLAKYTMEKLIVELLPTTSVHAIRLGGVFGPGEIPRPMRPRVSPITKMIHQALTENRIEVAANSVPRTWTYAPDIGRAVVAMLNAPSLRHPVYNVAAAHLHTPQFIAEIIQRYLPQATIERVPGGIPVQRGQLATKRLKVDTGFGDWTPITDGISHTITWQRNYLAKQQDSLNPQSEKQQ
jgi:nucleoside-diphosphate-sugar epimerase